MSLRRVAVFLAEAIGSVLLFPLLIWSRLPLPEYSRFTAPSQLLALVPGISGILLRRVWYRHTLKRCGTHLTVDWLAVIRTRDAEIGDRCTLGVGNWVGWVKMGNDVLTGSHVVFVSGKRQHGFDDLSRPMRQQTGQKQQVSVGDDVWIGAGAVIMADISPGTVVGAGAVVTRTHPPYAVLAGNPARVLRYRREESKTDDNK